MFDTKVHIILYYNALTINIYQTQNTIIYTTHMYQMYRVFVVY